jgi:hypothetical protein
VRGAIAHRVVDIIFIMSLRSDSSLRNCIKLFI